MAQLARKARQAADVMLSAVSSRYEGASRQLDTPPADAVSKA
jgi:hypothetical protein